MQAPQGFITLTSHMAQYQAGSSVTPKGNWAWVGGTMAVLMETEGTETLQSPPPPQPHKGTQHERVTDHGMFRQVKNPGHQCV